jgi:hypothetical protein
MLKYVTVTAKSSEEIMSMSLFNHRIVDSSLLFPFEFERLLERLDKGNCVTEDHIAEYFSGELDPNILITKVALPDVKVSNNCLDISTISCMTEGKYKAILDLFPHEPIDNLSGFFSFYLKLKLCQLSAIVFDMKSFFMSEFNLDILQSISFPSFSY